METLIKKLSEYKFVFLLIAMTGAFIGAIPFGTLWIVLVSIQVFCLLLGIFLSIHQELPDRKKSYNFVYPKDYEGIKKCNRCGKEIHGNSHGEGGKKGIKWRYWHSECYNIKFCEDIGGCPSALSKYYEIYGMSPEDKIINNINGE